MKELKAKVRILNNLDTSIKLTELQVGLVEKYYIYKGCCVRVARSSIFVVIDVASLRKPKQAFYGFSRGHHRINNSTWKILTEIKSPTGVYLRNHNHPLTLDDIEHAVAQVKRQEAVYD